jgi:hypothetical protein
MKDGNMNWATHETQPEEVMAYLDGELSPERASDVAQHLERCVECREVADSLRMVSQQASVWQVEPAPKYISERISVALHEQNPAASTVSKSKLAVVQRSRRFWLPRWGWGLAGTLAVLLIVVAVAIPPVGYRNVTFPPPMPQNATATTGAAGEGTNRRESGGYLRVPPPLVPPQAPVPQAQQVQPVPPMIIRTVSLTIVTREFETARGAIELTVRGYQGYIAQMNVSEPSGQARTLSATLRVPAERLDAALAELKKLGRVEQESQSGEEVTQQYVDLVARLSNSRNTEQRLIEIMRQRTGRVADILAVEQEIARVREEIERMEAQRKTLENRVGFATVQLSLNEEHRSALEVTPPSTLTRLWNDLVAGIRSVANSVLGLITFLLRYAPSLLFWILLSFWPARFILRRLRTATR